MLLRILRAIVGLAYLAASVGDLQRALELTSLVQQHPATWHEHRVRAEELVQRLEAQLSPETVSSVHRQAGERDPWDVVDAVLAEDG